MNFLLTIEGMLATAFVAGLILGLLLPKHWKAIGWALTALAAVFAAVRLTGHFVQGSTDPLDIPFAALWAAIGAFPGAALGSWLYRRFRRSA